MEKRINTPLNADKVNDLHAGDVCFITGTIYTARDAAHKRMIEQIAAALGRPVDELLDGKAVLSEEEKLTARNAIPFDITGETIYYLGPTPAREGQVIGSAGPTTSTRMDRYTPILLDLGLKGMIGKGRRSEAVKEAMKRDTCVYFAAVGGAGALLSKCIKKAEVIAYDDLGTEAIRRLEVEELPVIAVIDHEGRDRYEEV